VIYDNKERAADRIKNEIFNEMDKAKEEKKGIKMLPWVNILCLMGSAAFWIVPALFRIL